LKTKTIKQVETKQEQLKAPGKTKEEDDE